MATWKTRGLRGSLLEDLVNRTNDKYREQGLALIQKVPTPITPMQIDQESRHITLAYFNQKSTVDYIGVVQGIPVCFDAKECAGTTFSLQNVHPHQVQFMREFEQQEGIAFFPCLCADLCPSGTGRRQAAARASAWMNWTRAGSFQKSRGLWCLTWTCSIRIFRSGIDDPGVSYLFTPFEGACTVTPFLW